MNHVNDKKGTILITGASGGIGYELAQVFAKNRFNLILIARSEIRLEEIATHLRKEYDVNVKIIISDLSHCDAAQKIYDLTEGAGIYVDILINNAGAGACGFFHETDIKQDLNILQLNIVTLTYLTKLIGRQMVKRRKGKIINVASTGAYQPGPLIAVYYATKAYVLSFSEALANELKDYNITVTALCPGATKTGFSKNAGKGNLKNAMDAKTVAEMAYKGILQNKQVIIPGVFNKIMVFMSKILPRYILGEAVRKIQEKAMELD